MMRTTAWNPLGFHLFDALPKGMTFNAEYFRDNVRTALLPLCQKVDGRKDMIPANKTRSHTARKCRAFCIANRLRLTVHPPDSPNLVSSDFFLFGHINHCLEEMVFPSPEELLAVIREIVAATEKRSCRAYLTIAGQTWSPPPDIQVDPFSV
jgi:hypothetical protein